MLGINSGTTDSSLYNSNCMEELEQKVKARHVGLEEAVEKMCSFAKQNLKLNLNNSQILATLN